MLDNISKTNYQLEDRINNSLQGIDVSPLDLTISIIISTILSILIGFVYVKYGKSISNKKDFSYNFPLLSMTTLFIISVVKSSLALSLGLVGALSIVRFRSAIKEPEELIYLFICIAIGLGLGANQIVSTIIITIFIILFIVIRDKFSRVNKSKNFSLLITYPRSDKQDFDKIIDAIKFNTGKLDLQRYSEDQLNVESSILLNIDSYSEMRNLQEKLSNDFPNLIFDFIDNSNIL